ncbi:MAG: alpha-glucan family phosphorylase [Limisphaerales bacterium]
MSTQTPVANSICRFRLGEIEGFGSLAELALDLRWSWNHRADEVWRQLDPALWEFTQNAWVVLQTVSQDKLRGVLADPKFRKKVDALLQARRQEAETPGWFQQTHPQSSLTGVAYFSMEFMLSEALPIYSGGLGNVAGDQLKAASDLGLPVVGVGLLYQQGYFRQVIDKEGAQQALFPFNEPGQLPITPLRQPNGEWLRLEIALPGYSVWLRAWQVQVGRVKLYLLDTNDAANYPAHRGITSELYGGGPELRLKQELLLGIGGLRLLEALNARPQVCHLNEGHAAFAVLERASSFMKETGQPFHVALAATRAGNIFTTHTAVAAGFDCFTPSLIEEYLGGYARRLGITLHDLLALGRRNPDDSTESFNMAYLAIRGSGSVNGVSRLHGKVSRHIFAPLFPRWPEDEVPVGHVTNGVHMPSWDSAQADDLWTEACGKDRWLGTTEALAQDIRRVPGARLWQLRNSARKSLVEYARNRLSQQLAGSGGSAQEVDEAKHLFDPDTLTLGFARRFATYKRPNLLLHDPARLVRLLANPRFPVQLIIAGKAHPADGPGQKLIQEWIQFIRQPGIRRHVTFLSDYDMLLTERLVQGVDVWINTPRRPWEACGTSGMKVLVNGGINLSELDGWWAEAYMPEVGWALGDGQEHGENPAWDAAEAQVLYDILECRVIPEFYSRDEQGIPAAWVTRMRESMARLTPQFCANRAVQEYAEQHYLPAAKTYLQRAADKGAVARQVVDWQHNLEEKWAAVRLGEVKSETGAAKHAFEVQVYLGDLDPEAVQVELYADGVNGSASVRQEMTRIRPLVGAVNGYAYRGEVPASRPATDYTARVIPHCSGVLVPLEADRILWQR